MDYDVLAFIGRFQPFHNGHKAVVDQALTRARKVALVIGSHDQPRNSRNPFTTAERIEMITAVYPNEVAEGRIMFAPQVDHTYNLDRWIAGVQKGVEIVAMQPSAVTTPGWTDKPPRVGLIGHSKDSTSFYLKSFPTWGSVEVDNVSGINATDLRQQFFTVPNLCDMPAEAMPLEVLAWMDRWSKSKTISPTSPKYVLSQDFRQVRDEYKFIAAYKAQFAAMPFPPTFHTVDAVVVQSGHVLLVKRGAQPGKGLWALPGGFLEQDETMLEGMLRELKEETLIDCPPSVLRGSVVRSQTFDDPHRSLRGRTLTTAFYVRLGDRTELPAIKGSDDATNAKWVPLADLRRNMMFEDHYDIIETLVAI